jgi:hypothetical protein
MDEDIGKEVVLKADNSNLPDTYVAEKQRKEHQEDYEFVKRKTKSFIETGEEALEHLKDVAIETCDPRAFRVMAEMLTTLGSLTKNITDNSKNKSEVDKVLVNPSEQVPGPTQQNNTVNNTIFVGSTKDLLNTLQKNIIIDNEPTTTE